MGGRGGSCHLKYELLQFTLVMPGVRRGCQIRHLKSEVHHFGVVPLPTGKMNFSFSYRKCHWEFRHYGKDIVYTGVWDASFHGPSV